MAWHADTKPDKLGSVSNAGSSGPVRDTAVCRHSITAIRSAAGCVLEALRQVCDPPRTGQRASNAFCIIRPPGHHALCEQALRHRELVHKPEGVGGGFCLINNVMIGAAYARATYVSIASPRFSCSMAEPILAGTACAWQCWTLMRITATAAGP